MSFKILFMGTPDFAVPILKSIFDSNNKILEVYTQPPKKKNRGQKIKNSPIHDFANKLKLTVRHPDTFETNIEIDHIKKLKPDLVVVVAYGKILPRELLNFNETLFINVHASLLPKWRGAAPIQRSIMNMDNETGVSIMKMVPKLDAGPVLLKSKISINQDTNYLELSEKMSKVGAKLLLEAIDLIKNDKASFSEQNISEVTYAKKIQKTESKINWNESAEKILAKINALSPNPGCWFSFLGSRIKIIKAKRVIGSGKPGEIIGDKFIIACSKNAIQLMELKKEGKNNVSTDEFLRSNKIEIGQLLN